MASRHEWLSPQSAAAFVGGASAAMIAGRVLPPLFAQAVGSARAAMGRDPFEALIADHRKFVALLSDMERSDDRGRSVFRRGQLLFRLKRRLAAHALAEEDVLYPVLHDEAKAAHDAKHLYGDHADIKIHLHALEQMPKDDPEWVQRAGTLKRLIADHARQEEEVEFPKLRRVLDEHGLMRLSRNMQREKALIL